jgi:probable phosphoglycerate mutase
MLRGLMKTPCILTIVRHGQTHANIDGVWHGSINTPLTDHGHRQAAAAAHFIHTTKNPVSRVYASPLDRAHHTARAIGERFELEPMLVEGLAEYDLGEWEGETFADLHGKRKLFEHMRRDPDFRPHGGESPRQVGDRLAGALRTIAQAHVGERVVVVSHGGALSIALGLILDGAYSEWSRMMSNCAISELVFEPEPELLSFNETGHLPEQP